MKKVFIRTIILCFFFSLIGGIIYASGETVAQGQYGTISWILSDDGTLRVFGEGVLSNSENLWYAKRDSIKKVIVEAGITGLANEAFDSCQMTEIILPETIRSIGNNSFFRCGKLERITIPKNVETIEGNPFSWCSSLVSINVDAENRYYISDQGVLYDSPKTKLIRYPLGKEGESFVIPTGIQVIGEGAFQGCNNLSHVNIPDSVISIEARAFSSCFHLEEIRLPSHITVLEAATFCETSLSCITIPNGVQYINDACFFLCNKLKDITIPPSVSYISSNNAIPGNVTIHCYEGTFADNWARNRGFSVVYLPDDHSMLVRHERIEPTYTAPGIEEYWECSVCGRLFSDAAGTIEINEPVAIPMLDYPNSADVSGITYKLNNKTNTAVFSKVANKKIKTLKILDTIKVYGKKYKITEIGASACKGLKKLTTVTIGKNITKIGKDAFNGCKKLKTITIQTSKLTKKGVGKNCFKGIAKKAVFKCPKKKLADYQDWIINIGKAPKTTNFKK